ncbi:MULTISPECIES: polysaccharide deacetylase family protein [unclassified Paenibacillus]|uniref:polysaccharide deacetylase family protein n=1 Tax=unclassified Paenibacillus TaxID=185978 RepID=UPI0024056311|nr:MULTISPECIES: polysaccharide deacetylase family protein [unclassified Paenibacillus]MDF9841124.1 peptidoglycan/xylan/chitin deacetylase (PgdA/CDA1 family) [Paenibacillus sp. PastF-2]MDF9847704.1 peptidoglycan/xylan/chitin deacetylase (PgdA/CDA1 family) [Paenibacillus sp. PastM-2]MDF9854273.1 peptidoglycan/xylan/chitin deacetylase (PgdA/CDA1 family) [Paenibacillus sp. PastF-1]MDH6479556.1 peptidoglycan/xylan/chitin deacetylase (PgdA/CDA1 family) [Paenibacillus sp. PastH-2]MDH6505221.1 peptid
MEHLLKYRKLYILLCLLIAAVAQSSPPPVAASGGLFAQAPGREQQQDIKEQPEQSIPAGSALQAAARRNKRSKSLTLSQLIRKYPETFLTQGPRTRMIALTFDDVPDPRFTPQLLDVLNKYQVKATFFVVGSRAEKHPELVSRIIREGHVIGNHSYNHPEFGKLGMNEFRTQIIRTENIISALAGYKPRLIRPPYGDISEPQLKWAKARGYKLVNWNVDSLDWRGLSKSQVRNNIVAHAGKGAIILQHGGGGKGSNLQGTIQALPEVITIMRKRGYTFVTVPHMLQVSKNK